LLTLYDRVAIGKPARTRKYPKARHLGLVAGEVLETFVRLDELLFRFFFCRGLAIPALSVVG